MEFIIAFAIATILMLGNKIITYLKNKGVSMPHLARIRQIHLPHIRLPRINKKMAILGSVIAVAIIGLLIFFAPHNNDFNKQMKNQKRVEKKEKKSAKADTAVKAESVKEEAKKIWEQTVEALNKAMEQHKNPFPAEQKDYSGKKQGKKKKGDKK